MRTLLRTTGVAKISVQNSFCEECANSIKRRITKEQKLDNLRLYPLESLVVFNFTKANQVSEVLNLLTTLGYPPEGDRIEENRTIPFCNCKNEQVNYSRMVS